MSCCPQNAAVLSSELSQEYRGHIKLIEGPKLYVDSFLECSGMLEELHACSSYCSLEASLLKDLRSPSGKSLRLRIQSSSDIFPLISRMYLVSNDKFPDPYSQNQRPPTIGMKHFLKTDIHWIAPCLMPACCLTCSTSTSVTKEYGTAGARAIVCSSWLLLSPPSLNVDSAKFLRSVDSLLT